MLGLSLHRRSHRGSRWVLGVAILASLPSGCGEPADVPVVLDPVVRTTFHPTTYFAQRITGGLVPVECLAPADADPIFWRPSREDLERYQRARLIVLNGADLERWTLSAALPRSRVVESAAGFSHRFRRLATVTHSHGSGGEHTHEGLDGHTWLDPRNAIEQSRAIRSALTAAWPEHAEAFAENQRRLEVDLEDLLVRLTALRPRLETRVLLANHPAYDYLMERLELRITNLDLDPDLDLTSTQAERIRAAVTGDRVGILLWESEPRAAVADQLWKDLRVRSVVFSPCEAAEETSASEPADYLSRMRANVARLAEALD